MFMSPIDHFVPIDGQNSGRPSRTHENHFVPFLGPPYNKSVVLALLNMISENPRVNSKISRCVVECILILFIKLQIYRKAYKTNTPFPNNTR